jgi:predicted DNA-binding transcriptional regulator AlpA
MSITPSTPAETARGGFKTWVNSQRKFPSFRVSSEWKSTAIRQGEYILAISVWIEIARGTFMQRDNFLTTAAPDALLSDRDLEALTGRARPTLQKDRLYGKGIPFIKIGRLVRYRRSDVDRWIADQQAFASTSEYGAVDAIGRNSPHHARPITAADACDTKD